MLFDSAFMILLVFKFANDSLSRESEAEPAAIRFTRWFATNAGNLSTSVIMTLHIIYRKISYLH